MLADVLRIEISLGSTQKAWEEVSHAMEEPVRELQHQLTHEAVLNVDETGRRTNRDKRWIWALVASHFVFYEVAFTRSAANATGLPVFASGLSPARAQISESPAVTCDSGPCRCTWTPGYSSFVPNPGKSFRVTCRNFGLNYNSWFGKAQSIDVPAEAPALRMMIRALSWPWSRRSAKQD